MQVIIIGTKRAEICPVRRRGQDKVLFARKKQLYRVFPEDLIRCKIEKWGRHHSYDEVIAYEENQTVPLNPRTANYGKKEYFALIRSIKSNATNKFGLFSGKGTDWVKKAPYTIAILFCVGIVAWSLLTQQGGLI